MENYRKGAACIIIENKKILLTERKAGKYIGFWDIPAGSRDGEESFEQTIIREAKEETNLDIEIIEEIGVNIDAEYKLECHIFLARIIGGELMNVEPHAHFKIEFIDLNNLPKKLGKMATKGLAILSKRGLVEL
jgi:8-oxo-dGTP pyrophosphatase MutT (NUDIX family)